VRIWHFRSNIKFKIIIIRNISIT